MLRIPFDDVLARLAAILAPTRLLPGARPRLRPPLRRNHPRRRLLPRRQPLSPLRRHHSQRLRRPRRRARLHRPASAPSNAGTAASAPATSTPRPPWIAPSPSPASTASPASPSATPTTGCVAALTAGRPPTPASSPSAGPTPCPTSRPGAPSNPAIGNNPLVLAVPRPAGPHRPRHGHVPVLLRRARVLPPPRPAAPGRRRLRPRRPAHHRSRRYRSLPARRCPSATGKAPASPSSSTPSPPVLALGNATHQLSTDPLRESALSQTFIAIHPAALGDAARQAQIADGIVASIHAAEPVDPATPQLRYPGEQTLRLRARKLAHGLPIDETTWSIIAEM